MWPITLWPNALDIVGRDGVVILVAAVVNYLRTHFGNRYNDAVTTDDVKRVRP